MSLLELFCDVDDFVIRFAPQMKAMQLAEGKQRGRAGQLCRLCCKNAERNRGTGKFHPSVELR
jgi:hypothetical protein